MSRISRTIVIGEIAPQRACDFSLRDLGEAQTKEGGKAKCLATY